MKGAAMPIHTLHACLESVQLCCNYVGALAPGMAAWSRLYYRPLPDSNYK